MATEQAAPTAVIVDDSASIRALLKHALTQAGYSVVAEADSGPPALALYEQHRPTLMMLDIVLPGMDGVKVATELLKRHPEASVVMCSSLTSKDRILACRAVGVAHFILKPFTVEKVVEVATLIRQRAVERLATAVAS